MKSELALLALVVLLGGCKKTSLGPRPRAHSSNELPMPPRVAASSFHWVVSEGGAAGFIPAEAGLSSSFHLVGTVDGLRNVLHDQTERVAVSVDGPHLCELAPTLRSARERIALDIGIMGEVTTEGAACVRSVAPTALSVTPTGDALSPAVIDLLSHLDGVEALGVGYRGDEAAKLLGTRVSSPDSAALRYVNLVQSRLSPEALQALAARKNLQALGFRGMNATSKPSGLAVLATLPALERIDLSYTPVTDGELAAFGATTHLRWLMLESTAVGDAGVRPLAQLAELEYVNLGGTKVTDATVQPLAALPHLRWLTLGMTSVTEHILDAAWSPSLETLDLPASFAGKPSVAAFRAAHPKVKVNVDGER